MNALTEPRGSASTAALSLLHPTDFGSTSASALAHAVALSLRARGKLTLLHIRGEDEPGPTRNGLAPVADLLVRWGRLGAHEKFADLRARLGVDARCLDVPARSISEGLHEHLVAQPADLAVLATNPHSGLAFWFAGSVSRRALRQADAMILFVREGQRGLVDRGTGELRLTRALIPLDGRTPVAPTMARVDRLFERLGANVERRYLHVGDAPPPDAPKGATVTLARGPVAPAILEAALTFRADLIVMPTPGRRGVLSRFRNSVSAAILEDARWPVLSVPAL